MLAGHHLARVEEQLDRAVRVQEREAQEQRVEGHVAAARVEQPGDRIRRRDHRDLGARRGHRPTHAHALGVRRLAGIALVQLADGRDGRSRPRGPHPIDRIVVERDQLGAGLGTRGMVALDLGLNMQGGIVADAPTWAQLLAQPRGRRLLDQMVTLEQLRVELRLGLNGIAAVDEDRGALGEHDQHAR